MLEVEPLALRVEAALCVEAVAADREHAAAQGQLEPVAACARARGVPRATDGGNKDGFACHWKAS